MLRLIRSEHDYTDYLFAYIVHTKERVVFGNCESSEGVESLCRGVAGGCRGPGVTCFPDHEKLSALSLPCPRNHVSVLPWVAGSRDCSSDHFHFNVHPGNI